MLAAYAAYLRSLVDLRGIRPLKVVVDAGNGMGGHTVPDRPRRPAARRSSRCTSSSTAPSPTTRPTRSTRPTWSTCRHGWSPRRRRHRPGLRRRRRPLLRRRRARRAGLPVRGHRAGRRPRAGQAPRRDGDPQPDHLPGRARDRPRARRVRRSAPGSGTPSSRPRWPAPARSSAASTRRTTTSATSGAPTPACSPRCTSSPRSASRTGRCPSWPREYERYAASGEINSAVADQAGRDRRRSARAFARPDGRHRRRPGRPDRRRRRTGGSTCAPPTPSRCCG